METDAPPVRRARSQSFRQSEIARAIRGAMQAGMDVREVIATRDGIRIISSSASGTAATDNSWDEVLNDG